MIMAQPGALEIILLISIFFSCCSCHNNVKDSFQDTSSGRAKDEPKQKWGYVNVRKDAHMFWWLYYTTASEGYQDKPLVIWLQGGPGASSTGFGNFGEIGPLDVNLKPRNSTWVQAASILFIDNPVGAGYSYVTDPAAMATDNKMIAADLVTLIKAFLDAMPEFQGIPLYIFSESYGGKMAAGFAKALHQAIEQKSVKCNLQGVALGDSWISPLDYTDTWGPYLYATSLVDEMGLKAINKSAMQCRAAFEAGNFSQSTDLWSQTEDVTAENTNGVSWYNILKWGDEEAAMLQSKRYMTPVEKLYHRHVKVYANDALAKLMNGKIKKKLGIPNNVTWGGQEAEVFSSLSDDFMKPVIDTVDYLLATNSLRVVVYNAQLDLICNTIGTERWVQRLKWLGLPNFNMAPRKALITGEGTWGFVKSYKMFSFYWMMNGGHMLPADQGEASLHMLQKILDS